MSGEANTEPMWHRARGVTAAESGSGKRLARDLLQVESAMLAKVLAVLIESAATRPETL